MDSLPIFLQISQFLAEMRRGEKEIIEQKIKRRRK